MRARHLLVSLPLFLTSSAWAQSSDPAAAVNVGVGVVVPFHGDLDFTAPAWEAGIRLGRGTVVVDAVVGQWRHTESETRLNPVVGAAGGGVAGTVARIDSRTSRVSTRTEVDLSGRVRAGRIHVAVGGGAGMTTMRRRVEQRFTGCSSPTPDWCRPVMSEVSRASLSFQGVGTVDVPITARLSVYSAVRLAVPVEDVGSSELQLTAGGRLGW